MSEAKLMRAIGHELLHRIVPELRTADARERVAFINTTLEYLASDLDILPQLAIEGVPRLRAALERTLATLPAAFATGLFDYQRAFEEISSQKSMASAQALSVLREFSARLIRELSDFPSTQMTASEREDVARCRTLLSEADGLWLGVFDSARRYKGRYGQAANSAGATETEIVTAQALTLYLQQNIPLAEGISVKTVTRLPGGRSKRTFFIELQRPGNLPIEMVMRQDMYLQSRTTVRDEYEPLRLLSELGLPVPRPCHFEPQASALGPPFLMVERIVGEVPGSYFGMEVSCPLAFADLAALLGRLHRIEPSSAGVVGVKAASVHGHMGDQVEEYWRLWRKNTIWSSPVVESAYSWARSEYAATSGATALVHGDCGPHNLLVRDGRLVGLLDWEFLHVGDPAEDLGIARVYAEPMIPWREFMSIYTAAGGADVAERRVQLAVLLHYLKGTTLVAASGRNFAEGATDDFIKGANSYTGLRRIEMKIVEFFNTLSVSPSQR